VVARRIQLALNTWDATSVHLQEAVIGREKQSGAPLGHAHEHTALDLQRRKPDGSFVIPLDAHVRLASAKENWGQQFFRRSYSYDNGMTQRTGRLELDAGTLFFSIQRDPRLGFIPMYHRMSQHDALSHFQTHTGSVIAAFPPGSSGPTSFVGEGLFE
jgi:deferrochelatase/peroxidase EfeB